MDAPDFPAIRLSDAAFSWSKRDAAILNISSFVVERGERVFLEGPSGSGKSTLLSLIAGINTATSGRVEVLGTDLGTLSSSNRDRFRADHIGLIFQLFNLVPYLSIEENIQLPLRFSEARRERLEKAGIDFESATADLMSRLALDRLAKQGRAVVNMSVGEQQRVAVARALIGQPEIVVADEPTSALDRNMRESFIATLSEIAADSGCAILFVSHDDSLASFFDRSVRLQDVNQAPLGAAL